jgi:hypothetical protein
VGLAYRGASWFVLFIKNYPGEKIKKNKMGKACGTYGKEKRCIDEFGGATEGKRPLVRL